MPSHSDLLIKLKPPGDAYSIEPSAISNLELTAWGQSLDQVEADVIGLLPECTPSTVTADTIAQWENDYGIIPDDSKPLYQRLQVLMSIYSMEGSIAPFAIQRALFQFLGYNVQVTRNIGFLLDYNQLDVDKLDNFFTFTVTIESAKIKTAGYRTTDIIDAINRTKGAHETYILIIDGFRLDESQLDSVTTLAV